MVFLDANMLLEVLLPNRLRQQAVVDALLNLQAETAISMLSVHLVMHFGRQSQIPDELLHSAISRHTILPLAPEDYAWAKKNEQGRDLEDALQVAVAARNGCEKFVTLDKPLAKRYKNAITMLNV